MKQDIVDMMKEAPAASATIMGIRYFMIDPQQNTPIAMALFSIALTYAGCVGFPAMAIYSEELFDISNAIVDLLVKVAGLTGGVISTIAVAKKIWPKKKKTQTRVRGFRRNY